MKKTAVQISLLTFFLICLNHVARAQERTFTWTYSSDKNRIAAGEGTASKSPELLSAEKAVDEDKYEEALKITDEIISREPNYVWARLTRGVANLSLKRMVAAHGDVDILFTMLPANHPLPYVFRANIYSAQGKYDEALADATKAILFSPTCAAYCPNLSLAYYNRGLINKKKDLPAALNDFNKSIELDPRDTEPLIERAYLHLNFDKDYQAAVRDAAAAIRLNPNYADAFDARGFAYLYLSEWEKAVQDYTKAISLGRNKTTTYFNRGYAYEQLKQTEPAIRDYRRALELDPKNSDARKALDELTKKPD